MRKSSRTQLNCVTLRFVITRLPFFGFAGFGLFWGVWGASIPRIRDEAGVTDGQLGLALLFVGAGALPAMLLAGRALDRFGLWLTGLLLLALGLTGGIVALSASSGLVALCIGLALVGATSGAADVALNTLAGRVEEAAGRPIITPAQGTFSAAVVIGTLATGGLGALDAPLLLPFGVVILGMAVVCAVIVRRARPVARVAHHPTGAPEPTGSSALPVTLLIGVGILGALAFGSENAHQSWSAVFLEDELSVGVGLSAFGPAVFAGIVAITRFSVARVPVRHARTLVVIGAITATIGTAGLAVAPGLSVALLALTLAAAGTAVLFPTLLGFISRAVPEHRRARATSLVTVIAYTGFLAGPPYVGILAGEFTLRGAMIGVAALTAVSALLVPLVLRSRPTRTIVPAAAEPATACASSRDI